MPAFSVSTPTLAKFSQRGFSQRNLSQNQAQLKAQANQFCQGTLDILVNQLLNDLPSYTNRIIQRSKSNENLPFILLTSQADLTPLPLTQLQYQPLFEDTTKQFFFTVLERHYHNNKAAKLQSFYWAFFTPTNRGWELSQLKVQLASKNAPPLPPKDASQNAIAQGIKLWLRDCQAGTIPAFSNR
ncbi:MAG: hypothetical protein ACRC6M_12700 [Microcystaceae cyanobacterium]